VYDPWSVEGKGQEEAMKIAGIDVHKKVLMVVIIDASMPEEKPVRRRFATLPSELHRFLLWLREQGGRGGDGACALDRVFWDHATSAENGWPAYAAGGVSSS
jgi:hypothetical protein